MLLVVSLDTTAGDNGDNGGDARLWRRRADTNTFDVEKLDL